MANLIKNYFEMDQEPFGETPDPRFFFGSETHSKALSQLLQAIRLGTGFSMLTGEVGTGKTLLTRILLSSLGKNINSALILYPNCTEGELIKSICGELEITHSKTEKTGDPTQGHKSDVDLLNEFLIKSAEVGKKTVLIIEEAQNLPLKTLETVRLLSNLETHSRKLIQIILVAQPEFEVRLSRTDLRQLRQRISVKAKLGPLLPTEAEAYVKHRIERAGGANLLRFDPAAISLIHRLAGGIPRDMNRICQTIVAACQVRKVRLVKASLVRELFNLGRTPEWLSRIWTKNEVSPR